MTDPRARATLEFPRVDALRRLFRDGFSVADIAEPLASFDGDCDVQVVTSWMAILVMRSLPASCESTQLRCCQAKPNPITLATSATQFALLVRNSISLS